MRKLNITINNDISSDDIFNSTNQGLDIFRKELNIFNLNKNIKNPFTRDKTPSAKVKQSKTSGLYILSCYNTGEYYNAIQFIKKKYNLNYKEAIEYIKSNNTISLNIIKEEVIIKSTSKLKIDYEIIPFQNCHKEYWSLDEAFLNLKDIYAISRYSMYNKIYECKCSFVYEYRDKNGNLKDYCKILNLEVDKKNKWRTNLNNSKLWNLHTIKDNEKVIVCKSYKDTVLLEKLGYCAISVQSENGIIFVKNYPLLKSFYPNVKQWYLLFGSDEEALKESNIILNTYMDIINIKMPIYYSKQINDPFAIYKKIGKKKLITFINKYYEKDNS